MKKIFIFLCVPILLLCSACETSETEVPENSYDFLSIEGKFDISNVAIVSLPQNLQKLCSSYSFDYNVDGITVEGYISIPNECNIGKPYKCIIYNRGGNTNIGHLSDTDTARISAATNRIVIASQYRKNDEFGGDDLNDVLRLIDLCENFEFSDMTDFCSVGVSRGGMMTYMAARVDNRIKRIISISGVSDLTAAYNDRDDMKKVLNNFIGGSPKTHPKEYEKRSAICWADEITVPTLIIHSTKDQQVSYSQAEDIYNALSDNGVDVTLKTYNDSAHGLHTEDISIISQWLADK